MSGAIGGAIAVMIISLVVARAARSGVQGELRYGGFLKALGAITGLAAPGVLYLLLFVELRGSFTPWVLIFGFFVLTTIYVFLEDSLTRGTYDQEGITFRTPWSGTKRGQWSQLRKLGFNGGTGWYVLEFADGTKMRVPRMMMGHAYLLELLKARGFVPGGGGFS
ncbi:MAG: PH domain-containing protein [Myxococcales bacterium]|nr:MAG: PH domain-containing protein [Myxococcales bacterium]